MPHHNARIGADNKWSFYDSDGILIPKNDHRLKALFPTNEKDSAPLFQSGDTLRLRYMEYEHRHQIKLKQKSPRPAVAPPFQGKDLCFFFDPDDAEPSCNHLTLQYTGPIGSKEVTRWTVVELSPSKISVNDLPKVPPNDLPEFQVGAGGGY